MRLADARDLKRELVFGSREPGVELDRDLPHPRPGTGIGVAIGLVPRGRQDFAITLHIQRNDPRTAHFVESLTNRYPNDVEHRYVGRAKPLSGPPGRVRPVEIGCSIAHASGTAGTVGPFVTTPSGAVGLVSNNHVLALENAAAAGDSVVQPGPTDGGAASDRVAGLADVVELRVGSANLVDAAVGTLDAGIDFEARLIPGIGQLAGIFGGALEEDMVVVKRGRTTGVTRGVISGIELDDFEVDYGLGTLIFHQQLSIDAIDVADFGLHGDSGSLILLESTNEAVGLLFATTDYGPTYANSIDLVLSELKVSLLH